MTVSLVKRAPVSLFKIQRTSICTCHPPMPGRYRRYEGTGRTIVLRDGMSEWEHLDDATVAATHHCHVSRSSRDCDGGHGSDYVQIPADGDERGWNFVMWMHQVEYTINAASDGGTLTTDLVDGEHRAVWSAPTDEGYEHEERQMCSDPDCAYDSPSVYDQYAELAGY